MHVVCNLFVSIIISHNHLHFAVHHYRIVAENSVKYVPTDGLFGILIIQTSILHTLSIPNFPRH